MQQEPKIIVDLKNITPIGLHFLPCHLSKPQEVDVNTYFKPDNNNQVIMHGRRLQGQEGKCDENPIYVMKDNVVVHKCENYYVWKHGDDEREFEQFIKFKEILNVLNEEH